MITALPRLLQTEMRFYQEVAPAVPVPGPRVLAAEPLRPTAEPPYDPLLYQRVYTHVLRHRQTQVLAVDRQLPTATFSAYKYHMVQHAVLPTAEEVTQYIAAVERHYPDQQALQRDIAQWYRHP